MNRIHPTLPHGRPRNHARREPLYTLAEISDRVHIPVRSLRAYLSSVRVAAPAVLATTTCTHGAGRVSLYRLSEFKAWMETNQIANKYLSWSGRDSTS